MAVDKVMSAPQSLLNKEFNMNITTITGSKGTGADTNYENVEKIDKNEVDKVVQKLNEFMEPIRRNLKFELHDKLNKYYVTVVDSNINEVIKEIPPKKMLDMYAEMADFMGILIDRKI
ncbi:flagellar protein FlaG [Oceanobacillus sp. FSL K6-2867]|uniref:flagellar protein FlaG n=1 Tax=Oceanobacillus sp. FSL K6-2867 TaxID=2954748 RepID=UPI0030DA118B